MTIKAALRRFMDSREGGEITGWELFEAVRAATGRATYPETLLHYAREYCDIAGASLECLSRADSRYHYTPGARISGAVA